jgi:hypothetical protein
VNTRKEITDEIFRMCKGGHGMLFLRVLKELKYKEWPGTWNLSDDELQQIRSLMLRQTCRLRSVA